MDALAKRLLERLLAAGNKSEAGVRSRAPALTAHQLVPYRALRSAKEKSACEDAFIAARSAGAITIVLDRANREEGFFERIDLRDVAALAAFLGETPLTERVAEAERRLSVLDAEFPVVAEIVGKWRQAGKVRSVGPESYQDWLDAAAVIVFARNQAAGGVIAQPIREASAALFKDSKRIEYLAPQVDVLLSGATDTPPRPASEVWQEIGLFREEHPALLAGQVEVERERVTALLDAPYSGFPAATVRRLASIPQSVMSIENLTTFHSEAKRRCNESVLLLYTAGMPSPAWRAMYARLLMGLPADVPVYHWGDLDEGGFRIAAVLAKEAVATSHQLRPWAMHPGDIPEAKRCKAAPRTIERMQHFAALAGWESLADAIGAAGFTTEQEAL
ncbi:MAG: DUF2220 family protein [Azonexus sp.]|nr:DUF2220 family protein [Azonexus sp.]